jgi:hypothetical protein
MGSLEKEATMHSLIKRLAGLAALLATLIVAQPAPALAADLTLTPLAAAVDAGSSIEFAGANFRPGERIAIWATAPDTAVIGGEYYWASAEGTAKIIFDIPRDAIGGTWALTVRGDISKQLAIAYFQVNGRPAAEADRQVTVTPEAGGRSTRFVFRAEGFKDEERISFWITGPDGTVYSAEPEGDRADDEGEVSIAWSPPADAPLGVSVLTMQGIKSGRARAIPFTITG